MLIKFLPSLTIILYPGCDIFEEKSSLFCSLTALTCHANHAMQQMLISWVLPYLSYELIFTTEMLSLPDAPGLNTDLPVMGDGWVGGLPAQHWEILCRSDVNADS